MIIIHNRQRSVSLNKEQILRDTEQLLHALRYTGYELSIVFVNDRTMRAYNRDFRKVDRATDILSFPFYPELQAGKRIKPTSEETKILGDLIISPTYVRAAAEKLELSFEQRLRELLAHGLLHLLGYDHVTDQQYRAMRRRELQLLTKLPPLA